MPDGLVVWADEADDSESEKLARRLGVPFIVAEEPPEAPWLFFYDEDGLHLHSDLEEFEGFRPLVVDYLKGDFERRWRKATMGDILAKAIGVKKGVRTVCDATCGLGYDAFFLSTLKGLEVTACERNEVAAELVLDALGRVKDTGEFESRPLFFHFGDGIEFLRKNPGGFDAVYLDPMYPKSENQTAAPKKEMAMIAALVGKDPDAEALFDAAYEAAKMRVVVKRSDNTPPITSKKAPDFSLEGKTVRFDVYLKPGK